MGKNYRLEGKTIVITGASGGLGEQIAYKCAENGARLFLLSRNEQKLSQLAISIQKQYNVECTGLTLDVSQLHTIPRTVEKIYEKFGSIDVLVNNAGFGLFAEAKSIPIADVSKMFDVNVLGLIAMTNEVLPFMYEKRNGHIINIASQAGKLATPKSSVYSATKYAVLGYTNSLRMELAREGIFVTAVNPGPLKTNFFQTADPTGNYLENIGRVALNPEKVAERIVRIMLTRQREINVPGWMNTVSKLHTLFPQIVERVGRKAFFKK